jgi:hypothetical protein
VITIMRKRSTYRPRPALPPPGMRPMLGTTKVRDLSLVHHVNLDDIALCKANKQVLVDYCESMLLWSRVAELLNCEQQADMAEQLAVATSVMHRYRRTGKVGFAGLEYQKAKEGVALMDALAEYVPQHLASQAADWSEQKMKSLLAAENLRYKSNIDK